MMIQNIGNGVKKAICLFILLLFSFLFVACSIYTMNHIDYGSIKCGGNLILETKSFVYVVIGGIVLIIFMFLLFRLLNNLKQKHIVVLSLALIFIISLSFNLIVRNGVSFDQADVLDFTIKNLHGDYWDVFKGSYISQYPFLLGFSLYEYVALSLINYGDYNSCILFLQILNCILYTSTVYLGYKILCNQSNNKKTIIFYFLLSVLFVPMYIYTSFVYNEIVSFFFIYLSIYMFQLFFIKNDILYFCLCTIFISFSCSLRMNSLIILIAIALILLFKSIFEKKIQYIFLIIVIISSTFLFRRLVITYYEEASSYYKIVDKNEYRLDDGIPHLGHIAMGLNINHYDCYGWFDGSSIKVYIDDCNFDSSCAIEGYKNNLSDSLSYSKEHPNVAFKYITSKIISTWCDPQYDAFYFTGFNRINNNVISNIIYYGNTNELIKIYNDIYQFVLYLFAAIYSIFMFINCKKTSIENMILEICILGGFLFLLFWEASSRYVLPYSFFMVISASKGFKYCKFSNTKKN